jgi:hypothetical protein
LIPDLLLSRFTFTSTDREWTKDLFGFVRNMLDERYRTMGFLTPTQGSIGAPGDPRTYGVQVRLRF